MLTCRRCGARSHVGTRGTPEGLNPKLTPGTGFCKLPGGDLFSHPVTRAVSSALKRFTTVFGMGTGGAASLKPPRDSATIFRPYQSVGSRQPGS